MLLILTRSLNGIKNYKILAETAQRLDDVNLYLKFICNLPMSNYVRKLLSDGITSISLDFQDAISRMNWLGRIYQIGCDDDSEKIKSDGGGDTIVKTEAVKMCFDAIDATGGDVSNLKLCKRIIYEELDEEYLDWTGNDINNNSHHGAINTNKSQRDIRLHWRKSPSSQKWMIGCYRLNLKGLIDGGYVRRIDNDHVLLRFFHTDDGVISIHPGQNGPKLAIGHFTSE